MKYPTLLEVQSADRKQICKWYRFLGLTTDKEKQVIMTQIINQFNIMGGMTPEISKELGWSENELS